MVRTISSVLALLFCAPLSADQSEASEFERRARSLGQSITDDNSGKSLHCQQLIREMEQLQGKPQRRYTVRQQYMLECQPDQMNSPLATEPSDNY